MHYFVFWNKDERTFRLRLAVLRMCANAPAGFIMIHDKMDTVEEALAFCARWARIDKWNTWTVSVEDSNS